jgi:hypothetical protein
MTTSSSQAQQGAMQNCPQAGKWAISVWSSDSAPDTGQALATCGEGQVAVAYSIDPQTQTWLRWFDGRPEMSNLQTLNDIQGVIALGAAGAPPLTAAPAPSGHIAFADVPGLIEYEQVFEPRPAARQVYDASYRTFLEVHKRMRPLYRRINGGVQ